MRSLKISALEILSVFQVLLDLNLMGGSYHISTRHVKKCGCVVLGEIQAASEEAEAQDFQGGFPGKGSLDQRSPMWCPRAT